MFRLVPMQAPLRHRRIVWIAAAAVVGAVVLSAGALLVPHDEKSVEDFIASAQAERAAANFPAALVDLKNALAKDPENRTARLLCAQLYIESRGRRGRPRAAASRPAGRGHRTGNGRTARGSGASCAPIRRRRQAYCTPARRGLDRSQASMLAARASAYLALSETDAALGSIGARLSLNPHSVDVLIASARVFIAMGDLPQATDGSLKR